MQRAKSEKVEKKKEDCRQRGQHPDNLLTDMPTTSQDNLMDATQQSPMNDEDGGKDPSRDLDDAFAFLSDRAKYQEDQKLKEYLMDDYQSRTELAMAYMRFFMCSMGTARNTISAGLPLLDASECRQLVHPSVKIYGPAFASIRILGNRAIAERKAILKAQKAQLGIRKDSARIFDGETSSK